MQKKYQMKGVIGSIALVALLAGCAAAPPPQKTPEEVLKDGLTQLTDVNAYSYDVTFAGDLADPSGEKLNFNLKINGELDSIDPKAPKVVLKLDGTASDSTGMGGSAKGEVRMDVNNLYFNVMNLDIEDQEMPAELMELLNKWWMMPIPPGTFEEMNVTLTAEDEAMKEELKKALQEIQIFAQPEYVGTENVMGEASYHYRVVIDKKGLIEFARAAAEAEGETVSAADIAEAETQLENVDISGDVWVGTQSSVLNQFKGSVTLKGGAGEPSGTISISITIGNFNKPVAIQVPAGAEEFPAEEIFGAMMMMGGGLPTMDDSTMTDESMMFDESTMDELMMDANVEAMMESGVMEGDISEEELMKMMEGLELSQ